MSYLTIAGGYWPILIFNKLKLVDVGHLVMIEYFKITLGPGTSLLYCRRLFVNDSFKLSIITRTC